jgi:predicted unusual protein kinase regulating ubiquinone biosynthesis (AarF/ABC1/UbiB family)
MDVKPLLAELRERVMEELDYTLEADAQRKFAAAYDDDEEIAIPRVVASAPKVIVSEWIDGTPLSHIIAHGRQAARNRAGYLLALLHYSAPERAKLLHADPHPGNFRILSDGRLGVVDFGAVARLPDGSPEPLGIMTRLALEGRTGELMAAMRNYGFIRPGIEVDPQRVLDYLRPILDPLAVEEFTFTREWMRAQAARMGDPRNEEAKVGRMFNLPPSYLLLHRVTLGSLAVLCQLGATAPFRALAEQWQRGFAEPVG